MALKKFLMAGIVAAVLVACGDNDSSDFATRPSGDSSSACEDCDDSSSSEAKSSDSETSVSSSSSAKSSSSSAKSSSSVASSSSVPEGYVDPSTVVEGSMTDSRDGQTYKTVKIGTQIWMAENLNYTSDSASWCYNDSVEYCAKYGRLYTWAAAMDVVGEWSTNGKDCGYRATCTPTYPVRGICPEGWHLPDSTEWKTLFTAVGGRSTVSKKLKSTSGWKDSGNGTDAYSFSALPAGFRSSRGDFYDEGNNAYFWSSSEYNSDNADNVILYYNCEVGYNLGDYSKNFGLSVRCVKDLQAE